MGALSLLGLIPLGVLDVVVALPVTGLLLAWTLGPEETPRAHPVAGGRRTLIAGAVMAGCYAVVALLPQETALILALPWNPDLSLLAVTACAAVTVVLPLLMAESPAPVEQLPDRRLVVSRRNLVLATTGLVTVTFAHVGGQSLLAVGALTLTLAPVLLASRLRYLRRGRLQLGLLRHPWRREVRAHLLQALATIALCCLVAGAVQAGLFDPLRLDLSPAEYRVFQGALLGCLVLLALLALIPLRRLYLATNVLLAVGVVVLATQLVAIYRPPGGAVTIDNPLVGEWYVVQGGRSELVNNHQVAQAQHHALDIVQLRGGRSHARDGAALEDYYAFGQPLLAPADGIVTSVVDVYPDQRIGTVNLKHQEGNQVVVDVGTGHYVVFAHIMRGSPRVEVGDRVRRGQAMARVGNSGNSDQPHLHLQVQNRPTLDVFDPGEGFATSPLLLRDVIVTRHGVPENQPQGDLRRGDSFHSQ